MARTQRARLARARMPASWAKRRWPVSRSTGRPSRRRRRAGGPPRRRRPSAAHGSCPRRRRDRHAASGSRRPAPRGRSGRRGPARSGRRAGLAPGRPPTQRPGTASRRRRVGVATAGGYDAAATGGHRRSPRWPTSSGRAGRGRAPGCRWRRASARIGVPCPARPGGGGADHAATTPAGPPGGTDHTRSHTRCSPPARTLRASDVVIRAAIVALALATAYIHSTLGGLLFTLNARRLRRRRRRDGHPARPRRPLPLGRPPRPHRLRRDHDRRLGDPGPVLHAPPTSPRPSRSR